MHILKVSTSNSDPSNYKKEDFLVFLLYVEHIIVDTQKSATFNRFD
jgi:hypothetical protein